MRRPSTASADHATSPDVASSGKALAPASVPLTLASCGLAAQAVSRSHNSVGAFYRHMRARPGTQSAIVATAHKLARIAYHLLTHRTPFHDLSATEYERRTRDRDIAVLRNKAAELGLTLVESSTSSTNI
jgi:hypothetical protein